MFEIELLVLSFSSIFEKILMPMALADSKLLPQWIFICPREKLHFFWSRVSVAMSSSFICQVLLDPPRLKVKENMAFLVSLNYIIMVCRNNNFLSAWYLLVFVEMLVLLNMHKQILS